MYCPSGGTYISGTCYDATPCTSPQVRQTSSPYACYTPVICDPPETANEFGICGLAECTSAQVLNPSSGVCQDAPFCGATERYDPVTNTCYLKKLECPEHSHANTENDVCLADPPLACPSGQHDDGTWVCVADDAKGCKSNQTVGYINGQLQCINPPNLDSAQQAAADAAKAAAATAQSSSNTAASAAQAANDALAADPTNTTKQAAAVIANAEAGKTKTEADNAAAKAAQEAAKLGNDLLSSVDYTLKKATIGKGKEIVPGTVSIFDTAAVDAVIQSAKSDYQTAWTSHKESLTSLFDFSGGSGGSLPVISYGTIKGVAVQTNIHNYSDALNYIGLIVMFLAAFLSIRLFLE